MSARSHSDALTVQAVGLDFGGTLTVRFADTLALIWRQELVARLGVERGTRVSRLRADREAGYWKNYIALPHPALQLLTWTLADELGPGQQQFAQGITAEVERRFIAEVPESEGAADLLSWLEGRHLPVGILSNFAFPASVIQAWLDARHLAQYIAVVLANSDASLRKPAASAFWQLANRLGVNTRCLLFVGNNWEEDVMGALHAGLSAVYRTGADPSAGQPRDDARVHPISTLSDLPAIIMDLNG